MLKSVDPSETYLGRSKNATWYGYAILKTNFIFELTILFVFIEIKIKTQRCLPLRYSDNPSEIF